MVTARPLMMLSTHDGGSSRSLGAVVEADYVVAGNILNDCLKVRPDRIERLDHLSASAVCERSHAVQDVTDLLVDLERECSSAHRRVLENQFGFRGADILDDAELGRELGVGEVGVYRLRNEARRYAEKWFGASPPVAAKVARELRQAA